MARLKAILLHFRDQLALAGVAPFVDGDALAQQVDILRGRHVAARHPQGIAGHQAQAALVGADQAAFLAALCGAVAVQFGGGDALAVADAETAAGQETVFLDLGELLLGAGGSGRFDGELVAGGKRHVAVTCHGAATHRQVASCLGDDGVAAAGCVDRSRSRRDLPFAFTEHGGNDS